MKGAIDPKMIQKNLSLEMFCQIPDDPSTCLAAVNQGKPIYEIAKSCEVIKMIDKLTSQMMSPIQKGGKLNGTSRTA